MPQRKCRLQQHMGLVPIDVVGHFNMVGVGIERVCPERTSSSATGATRGSPARSGPVSIKLHRVSQGERREMVQRPTRYAIPDGPLASSVLGIS